VPAGVYAKAYLERAGIWNQLQPKLLTLANVRAALAAVESGGADAAIVYESDAATSRSGQVPFVFKASDGPAILYPAAIVRQSRNRQAAEKFLAFLQGKEANAIFRRLKFSAPPLTPGPADLRPPGSADPRTHGPN
jgi:molybdate transport system substrate-binding protein